MKKKMALLLFVLMGTFAFSSHVCCELEALFNEAVETSTQIEIMDAMIHEGCV